jgi:hypothetical protein
MNEILDLKQIFEISLYLRKCFSIPFLDSQDGGQEALSSQGRQGGTQATAKKKKSKVNQLDTVFAYLAVERNWNQAIRDENPDFFSQVPRRAYAKW